MAAGIVMLDVSPAPTLLVKKPDSWRRRCSKAAKKKVRSFFMGPPKVAPYCARVNGGLAIGANAFRAWKLLWRRNPKTFPSQVLVPALVTTLIMPPVARPNSGAYEFVAT